MKAHVINRQTSHGAKVKVISVKVKYQDYIFKRKMAVVGAFMFHQHILFPKAQFQLS